MFCVNCFSHKTSVANSRTNKKRPAVWRRRNCNSCGQAFTTYERPSLADNKPVLGPGGGSDVFNVGRLIISIAASFTHDTEAGKTNALPLAQTVEDILTTEHQQITPDDIAAVTHQVLRQFDEVAAVQYAARHQLIEQTRRRGRPSTAPGKRRR